MKLTRLLLPLLLAATATSGSFAALLRWDGEAGDNQWNNPLNWAGNILPSSTDDVVLDNTFLTGNYLVNLPAGSQQVTVRSLVIMPGIGNTIELALPPTNVASNAFTVTRAGGDAVQLYAGGIFRNASGVGGGDTFTLNDSLVIYDGGKYVHQNRGTHRFIVPWLARRTGTSQGMFEFNVPSSAAYSLSLSMRTYGQLILSSDALGGTVTYTAMSVNPIVINSDLVIGNRVRLTLSASDTLHIGRHLLHDGNTLNLSSSTRALTMAIAGNWMQSAGATVTETGSVGAAIVLMGAAAQVIDCQGTVSEQVSVTMNNAAGITLQSDLSLPYQLSLVRGKVHTSTAALLTLQAGCTVVADSLSNNSFVHGPLRKEGLSSTGHFLFPVGKGNAQRWLSLTQATGNYTVEFFRDNPRMISTVYGTDIHHISSIEHWSVEADLFPAAQAKVKLSFNDPNSGGVTNLAALRVAQHIGGIWISQGNVIAGGTAGSHGFVSSTMLNSFTPATKYFSLASSLESFNPLYATRVADRHVTAAIFPRLQLTPSVTSGDTKLTLTLSKKSKLQVLITDLQGRSIRTWTVAGSIGINNIAIPAADLQTGAYQISVFNEHGPLGTTRLTKL